MTQQWDYQVELSTHKDLQDNLNTFAAQGWELMYLAPYGEPFPDHPELSALSLVFKRGPLNP